MISYLKPLTLFLHQSKPLKPHSHGEPDQCSKRFYSASLSYMGKALIHQFLSSPKLQGFRTVSFSHRWIHDKKCWPSTHREQSVSFPGRNRLRTDTAFELGIKSTELSLNCKGHWVSRCTITTTNLGPLWLTQNSQFGSISKISFVVVTVQKYRAWNSVGCFSIRAIFGRFLSIRLFAGSLYSNMTFNKT